MRPKRPDKMKALSIVEASERDMRFTLGLEPTEASASTIVRNIYECFRMLGDALLIARGIEAHDHKTQIMELLKVDADTARPIQVIVNLRQLRHTINYYGYRPKLIEVEDVISIADCCFKLLHEGVVGKIREE